MCDDLAQEQQTQQWKNEIILPTFNFPSISNFSFDIFHGKIIMIRGNSIRIRMYVSVYMQYNFHAFSNSIKLNKIHFKYLSLFFFFADVRR